MRKYLRPEIVTVAALLLLLAAAFTASDTFIPWHRYRTPPLVANHAPRPDRGERRKHRVFAEYTLVIPPAAAPPTRRAPGRTVLPDGFIDTGRIANVTARGQVSLRGFGFGAGTDDTDARLLGYTFRGRMNQAGSDPEASPGESVWSAENANAGIKEQQIQLVLLKDGEATPVSAFFSCERTIGPLRLGMRSDGGGTERRWFADGKTRVTWKCAAAHPRSVTRRYREIVGVGKGVPDEAVPVEPALLAVDLYAKVPYQSQPAASNWPDTVRFRGLELNGARIDTSQVKPETTGFVMRGAGPGAIDCTSYKNIYTYRPGAVSAPGR